AAQVDADDAVPAFRRHLEEVAANGDLDAGIVDQTVDAGEGVPGGVRQRLVPGEIADVAAQECGMPAARLDAGQGVADRFVLDDVVDDDVEPAIGERPADRPPDPAAPSGDEGGRTLAHSGFPILITTHRITRSLPSQAHPRGKCTAKSAAPGICSKARLWTVSGFIG